RNLDVAIHEDDLIFVPLGKHKRVFVMGEVTHPMVVDLKNDDTDVLQAIAEAGGLTPNGSQTQVKLIRRTNPNDTNPAITSVNLKDMARKGDLSQNIKLRDQDVILVPRNKTAFMRFFTQNGGLGLVSLVLSLSGI